MYEDTGVQSYFILLNTTEKERKKGRKEGRKEESCLINLYQALGDATTLQYATLHYTILDPRFQRFDGVCKVK